MSKTIQPVRGMNDILPEQTALWQRVEAAARETFAAYGYGEIRLPAVEKTALFARSIGDATDIVEKEMYTFEDRSGESLSLRPEGTAGCVRAGISNGLLYNQTQRLWYAGPMFRHERPQKGRYRQFHQLGLEAYGMAGPDIDAEVILVSARLWQKLGLTAGISLQLNSLGTPEARAVYREKLVAYFEQHQGSLDADSKRRLATNPLRILDSKNPAMQNIIADAPVLMDFLDAASREHFDVLRTMLDTCGISYTVNPRLVRGLDYYSRTVFEWVTDKLGAQDAVCSGGRYDDLVELLGGQPTPAIGWALGLERLVALLEQQTQVAPANPDVFIITSGTAAKMNGLALAEQLRNALPGLKLISHCGDGSFKSQFKKADKSGARFALILGEDEVSGQMVSIKPLRDKDAEQHTCSWKELPQQLAKIVN